MLTITNMAAVQKFEVICDKFNVMGIHTSSKYAHAWMLKLYIY